MKKIFGMAALALAIGFASCSKDNTLETGGTENSAVMAFTFNKPQSSFITYADIASNAEWFIDGVDVYVAIGGEVGKLTAGTSGDYTIEENSKSYTITMSRKWVSDNLGGTANFYFVGNDAISTEGPHASLALQANLDDEAEFKNALANELQDSGSGKYDLIVAPDGQDTGLLFSAYLEGVKIEGKVNKSTTLYRREARFDVENPMYKDDAYEVTEILVSDASTSGLIFGNGNPAGVTINKKSHVSIAGFDETAYDAATELATSRFYLYPTEMSETAGDGKTEITLMVSIGGEAPVAFPVDGSLVNYKIEANTRYILVLDETSETVGIRVADYDEADEKLPATPGADDAVTPTNFVATGDGVWDGAAQVYTFTATNTNTLAFDVVTKFGTEATVDYVFGGNPTTLLGGLTPVTTTTYAGYETTDKYTIAVPADANNGFSIRLTIRSKNGEGKSVILFQKGEIDVTTEISDPKLADAIKKAVDDNNGDPTKITGKDLEDITKIDISAASGNDAGSLDGIESLPNLKEINAVGNTNLKEVDLSGNSNLEIINLLDSPNVSELILEGNTSLKNLAVSSPLITDLDLSQCPNLETINIRGSGIKEIDLSKNPELKLAYFHQSSLTTLDLSNCLKIEQIRTYSSTIETMILSTKELTYLKKMELYGCPLKNFDFSKVNAPNCTNVRFEPTVFDSEIDLTGFPALTHLYYGSTAEADKMWDAISMNITNCKVLKYLVGHRIGDITLRVADKSAFPPAGLTHYLYSSYANVVLVE